MGEGRVRVSKMTNDNRTVNNEQFFGGIVHCAPFNCHLVILDLAKLITLTRPLRDRPLPGGEVYNLGDAIPCNGVGLPASIPADSSPSCKGPEMVRSVVRAFPVVYRYE